MTCESLTVDIVDHIAHSHGSSFGGVMAIAADMRRMVAMRERLSAVEAHPFMQRGMETAHPTAHLATTFLVGIADCPHRLEANFMNRDPLGNDIHLLFA